MVKLTTCFGAAQGVNITAFTIIRVEPNELLFGGMMSFGGGGGGGDIGQQKQLAGLKDNSVI